MDYKTLQNIVVALCLPAFIMSCSTSGGLTSDAEYDDVYYNTADMQPQAKPTQASTSQPNDKNLPASPFSSSPEKSAEYYSAETDTEYDDEGTEYYDPNYIGALNAKYSQQDYASTYQYSDPRYSSPSAWHPSYNMSIGTGSFYGNPYSYSSFGIGATYGSSYYNNMYNGYAGYPGYPGYYDPFWGSSYYSPWSPYGTPYYYNPYYGYYGYPSYYNSKPVYRSPRPKSNVNSGRTPGSHATNPRTYYGNPNGTQPNTPTNKRASSVSPRSGNTNTRTYERSTPQNNNAAQNRSTENRYYNAPSNRSTNTRSSQPSNQRPSNSYNRTPSSRGSSISQPRSTGRSPR